MDGAEAAPNGGLVGTASDSTPVGARNESSIDIVAELDRVLGLVERATGMSSRYGDSLDSIEGGLGPDLAPDAVRAVLHRLRDATRQVMGDNATLNADLRRTKREMQAMRATLTTARKEATTDALTELRNRRYFDSVSDKLVTTALGQRAPLALLMLDVDHFKRFNDQHGHQIGDQVLRLVASALRQHMPEGSTTARYGGEEFVAMLPGVDLMRAIQLAETVRQSVGGKELVKRSTSEVIGRITISIGVSAVRPSDDIDSLVERADRCLIGAKALGRDRSVGEHELPIHAPLRRAG